MELYFGVMSGTSCDGIDIALVDLSEPLPRLVAATLLPYSDSFRLQLKKVASSAQIDFNELAFLENTLADLTAKGIIALLASEGLSASAVNAIGFHGQTIFHDPGRYSFQIGDPNRLAFKTGIPVVADFRRMDIAAGGEGAPLAGLIHQILFYSAEHNTAVINLGGIANITFIPRDRADNILAYDIGPANTIMDQWSMCKRGEAFDEDGVWARSGKVLPDLLDRLLSDPYFRQAPPKSTGPEYFNLNWLGQYLTFDIHPAELQATLLELTVCTIAEAIKSRWNKSRIFLSGGGAHNLYLVERLKKHLSAHTICNVEEGGFDSDQLEALFFAWLAKQRIKGIPQDLQNMTGAKQPVCLGGVFQNTHFEAT